MLVYLNYPTSLNNLSLNESTKVIIGYKVRKKFLNLTLLKTN